MKKTLIALLTMCCLAPAVAQPLAECLETARKNNIGVRLADLQVQQAARMEGSWFAAEKAELSLSQDPTSGGSPDNALTLSQRFDFPTIYGTRRNLLKAETQVEESRREVAESELVRDVSSAYCSLLYWQHIEALLTTNDSLLDYFAKTADVHLQNGVTSQLELMNAQSMRAENRMHLQEVQDAKARAAVLLQQLMNTTEEVVATDDLQCIQPAAEAWSFASTPQGRLAESKKNLGERQLSASRQEWLPSVDIGLRYQCVIPGINPYDIDRTRFEGGNWMGFEVGLSFPLFYGSSRAKRDAARLDVEMAQYRMEQASQQAAAEMQMAERMVITARQAYNYYQDEGLGIASEIRRLSCIEYETGEIGYVEHAQNLATALNIEMASAKAADALNQAIIQFNFIKGK